MQEQEAMETPTPQSALGRTLLAALGVTAFLIIASCGVGAFLIGVRGVRGIVAGRYEKHLVFAWFFYAAVLIGSCLIAYAVYQKVRHIVRERSWW